MDKNKDFLHDLWYVSGVNEDIWSTLIDNYNNAPAKEEKDHALAHIKWHLGYKQDDGKLKEIEKKIENSTQVKLTFTANEDTTVDVYFTKESFDSETPDDTISLTANQEKTTTYDRENIYIFRFADSSTIISTKINGALLNCFKLFYKCYNLISLDVINFDTSKVTNMCSMFHIGLPWIGGKLINLDVSHFDTSNVTDMSNMFDGCSKLINLDVSHFDTSNVTDMSNMFDGCSKLINLDVSHFDTSNVTNMSNMFGSCHGLTTLDLSHFDTSNVTNMSEMFSNCSALTSLDVTNFDTSNVTGMSNMFQFCSSLVSLDITNFDTSNVTDMRWIVGYCSSLTSLDLSHLDTSNVTNMSDMFVNCEALTSLDLSNFNTAEVTNMNEMFADCSKLTTIGPVDTAPGWQHKPDEYHNMFNNCPASPKPTWYTA